MRAVVRGRRSRQADLVLFVIDARAGHHARRTGISPQWLRRQGRPVLLVANKAEGRAGADAALEAYSLGLGEPVGGVGRARRGHRRPDGARSPTGCREPADAPEADGGAAAEARHRRPAERRQIDAAQPAARRGAHDHRPGAGADARRGRRACCATPTARRSSWSTPPACAGAARIEQPLEKLSVGAAHRGAEDGRGGGAGGRRHRGLHDQDLQIARLIEREGRALRAGAEQVGRGGRPRRGAARDRPTGWRPAWRR